MISRAARPALLFLRACLITGLTTGLITGPALSADDQSAPWPVRLRADMERLANVSWRLRVAAGATCPRATGLSGITIDHIEAYDKRDRDALQALFAMGESPQIAAVAQDSPAAQAGLRPGDLILAIDGLPTERIVAKVQDRTLVSDEVERVLERRDGSGPMSLRIERADKAEERQVRPRLVCAADFEIKTDGSIDAYSGDGRIAISTGVIAFARSDDELALVAGHELAHVIYGDDRAKGLSNRRYMEDRADLLGAALLTCAGYDKATAVEYRLRYGRQDRLRWLRSPTHRNPQERARRLLASPGGTVCPLDAANVARLSAAALAAKP